MEEMTLDIDTLTLYTIYFLPETTRQKGRRVTGIYIVVLYYGVSKQVIKFYNV